ncbi:hypothetical protein METBIDRAFT_32095 [Metschnikowia bicuspidata var. bicuspidata NRRL YB-4993]|uniref:Uncharacterized protein n=1 Tax=Metschnikowia bicuspidata var. bicuspidata NRRL YB-4993 TaxID=869754 RepID=A0A1A0HCI9_9ASCO|nr:hypothetical protein METBIDRAFT_32095 [Metschnikowia bicuspidata var. bicuspidata NRRL YB-4993]OBA21602.1 hypothetical protein METBIDRAFT_32095 [Metschnikowia bicuspidata var. bicuspidata NRRL YB-4993]
MSIVLECHTPLRHSVSSLSIEGSMFENIPNSPDSWRFDASPIQPPASKSLQTQLQDCALDSLPAQDVQNAHTVNLLTKQLPMLPNGLPRIASDEKDIDKQEQSPESPRPQNPQASVLAKASMSLLQLTRLSSPAGNRAMLASALLRLPPKPLAFARAPPTNLQAEGAKKKLKINVRSPDEDEILAIRIHKEKLRSVRELADVVTFKLNVRYCLQPDDLQCFLVFPDRSLPTVELGSDNVSNFLEDFIMEYILARLKIYIEARLKADRRPQDEKKIPEA